jgi:hypothetical protein
MSEALRGLLVEDGSLAIGILVALVAAGVLATVNAAAVDLAGWILVAVLAVLFVANLHRAGRRAATVVAAPQEREKSFK